ncbi:MAG: RdgB/HAM1 family non-canonical purine NTP pyrophosphatase [Candidatus Aminicenantes bacterium]|nr:RdgB/HAM1 family non-canonical purine NTP pyrophosphatase [Candidatus Aminicenantes bacterium]
MKSRSTETPILVGSTNRGKIAEIRRALAELPVVLRTLDDFPLSGRAPETGATFAENARAKSLYYSRRTGFLTLAEDSGLEVESLGGAPGVRSARFAGPRATDEQNIRKLLGLLEGKPPARRRARFVCCMALSRRGRVLKTVTGRVRGTIAPVTKGEGGFGYDPVFGYAPLRRTFAELTADEKNRVSHRGRALRKLTAFLASHPSVLKDPAGGEEEEGGAPPPPTSRSRRPRSRP